MTLALSATGAVLLLSGLLLALVSRAEGEKTAAVRALGFVLPAASLILLAGAVAFPGRDVVGAAHGDEQRRELLAIADAFGQSDVGRFDLVSLLVTDVVEYPVVNGSHLIPSPVDAIDGLILGGDDAGVFRIGQRTGLQVVTQIAIGPARNSKLICRFRADETKEFFA